MKTLIISPKYHFGNSLPRLVPRKGENRKLYFWRIFRGLFNKHEEKEINTFFRGFAWEPMDPKWVSNKRGCYLESAYVMFKHHPQGDRIVSALYYADITWAHPEIAGEILERIQKVWAEQQARATEEKPLSVVSVVQRFFKDLTKALAPSKKSTKKYIYKKGK